MNSSVGISQSLNITEKELKSLSRGRVSSALVFRTESIILQLLEDNFPELRTEEPYERTYKLEHLPHALRQIFKFGKGGNNNSVSALVSYNKATLKVCIRNSQTVCIEPLTDVRF